MCASHIPKDEISVGSCLHGTRRKDEFGGHTMKAQFPTRNGHFKQVAVLGLIIPVPALLGPRGRGLGSFRSRVGISAYGWISRIVIE
jgi:hypothetical protein